MIYKPSEFFEKKKIQEQLQQKVVEPEENVKKISNLKSPSELLDPKPIEEKVEEIEEEIIEEIEVDPIEEIKSLVDEVRSQISDIPEIKTYDEELNSLREEIDRIYNTIQKHPEPKYYDEEVKELHHKIDSIEIPEVKYYEDDIQEIHQKIDSIEIPEVKYYEDDIQEIHQKIDSIEVPEIKYYDKEIYDLKKEIAQVESKLSKIPKVKYYDEEVKELHHKIDSIEIPEVKYYEDDIQEIHQKIDSIEIPEVKYYDEEVKELHHKIDSIKIPEVKYYDNEIYDLKTSIGDVISTIKEPKFYDEDIEELRKIIKEIKEKQETLILSEGLINGPPETNTKDPLTPLNQNFATLDDLKNHYKLFINRIQQQLSTLGGGGETKLRYLDDVVGIATNPSVYDGKFLKYNHSTNKFEFSDVDITNDYWDNNDQDEVYTLSKVAIGTDHVGTGSTVLVVNGDARITGILSIGQGTVTVDGNSNEIYVSNIIVQDTIATAEGVEYATTTYVDNVVSISTFSKDYNELFNTPSLLSEFNNDVGFATVTYIDVAISNLINFAPDTLDTLNELAAALNDDENFATTVTNSLASKANLSGATFTGVVTATSGFLGNLTGDLIGEVNATAFDTNSSGVVVTGILTATSGNFSGIVTSSGANISGVVTATDFNSASDIKLKNNVTVIDKALDKVSQLDGVSFDWKDTGRSSLGVIAQDVEKVLPELVSGEENKTVNYNGLVGLLIQCVKEQQKEIEELRRLIDK